MIWHINLNETGVQVIDWPGLRNKLALAGGSIAMATAYELKIRGNLQLG